MRPPAEIAIVIPAYNAARFLGEAIESVVAQSFPHWSLTIVDDGSRDDTADIAEAYVESDCRIGLCRQPNAGVSAARNHGYAMSPRSAPFVLFLDSDDALLPSALEALHADIAHFPDAAAAYGLAGYIDTNGASIRSGELEAHQRIRMGVEGGRVIEWPIDRPTTFAVEAVMEYIITPGTVLIRRDALDRAGLFHTDIGLWEDWDLWLRLTRVGDMRLIDQSVLRYRRHDSNASNEGHALDEGERAVRARLFESLAARPELLRIAELGYRHQQVAIARKRLAWAGASLAKAEVVPAARQLRHAATRWVSSLRRPPRQPVAVVASSPQGR